MAFNKVAYVDDVTVIRAKNLNDIQNEFDNKLDKNQGVAHAGEFCVVGADGYITTQAMTNAETEAM